MDFSKWLDNEYIFPIIKRCTYGIFSKATKHFVGIALEISLKAKGFQNKKKQLYKLIFQRIIRLIGLLKDIELKYQHLVG